MSVYYKERPEYLGRSIDSILSQTLFPDEIVIVKDGPITKELEDVIETYILQYPGLFNLVSSEKNLGLGLALNLGLRHCKNELVVRMDTDDVALPFRCEKQVKEFESDPELSVLGGQISEFIEDETNIIGQRIVPLEHDAICRYLKARCPFNHMTVMFRKSHVLAAGNYQDWFWNEDYYLWIRMAQGQFRFRNLPDTLVNVRVGVDMYRRRGGIKYFKSEFELQKYMLETEVIGVQRFIVNVVLRLVVQVIMPSRIRGVVFKRFARTRSYK